MKKSTLKSKIKTCNTHEPITLSGRVFLRSEDPQVGDLQTGDLCLWFALDAAGRSAMAGRHTNYGYSGFVKASIFDGKKRHPFLLWELIEEEKLRYGVKYESDETAEKVLFELEKLKGQKAVWQERTYALPEVDTDLSLKVERELATQIDNTGSTLLGRRVIEEDLRLERIPKVGEIVSGYASSFNVGEATIALADDFEGHLANDSVFFNHGISPETAMSCGRTVEVKVLSSDRDFIAVELVRSKATDILNLTKRNRDHAGEFLTGKVVIKKDYGLFIKIDNGPAYGCLGLVHISELPGKTRVERDKHLVSVKIGTSVSAEVINTKVKNERIDIALSMTTVSTMKS